MGKEHRLPHPKRQRALMHREMGESARLGNHRMQWVGLRIKRKCASMCLLGVQWYSEEHMVREVFRGQEFRNLRN